MFIKRNNQGHITAVSTEELSEFKAVNQTENIEVQSFLKDEFFSNSLAETDAEFIRVLDDLLKVMINKRLIQFTDLPKAAQIKLLNRESLRENSSNVSLIGLDDEESIHL